METLLQELKHWLEIEIKKDRQEEVWLQEEVAKYGFGCDIEKKLKDHEKAKLTIETIKKIIWNFENQESKGE